MKQLLSIGEVAKIKNVSHRMLRHYDQLGILIPAYTNDETGYRYYSKSQMVILDLILICTEVGIPLKQFNNYKDATGAYNLEKILLDGKELADEKLKQINFNIRQLDLLSSLLQDAPSAEKAPTIKSFSSRYLFVVECSFLAVELELYWKQLSQIYMQIDELQLTSKFTQGECIIYRNSGPKFYSYVEIEKPAKKHIQVLTLPSGNYSCELFSEDSYNLAVEKYNKSYTNDTILLIADAYTKKICDRGMPLEIQLLEF